MYLDVVKALRVFSASLRAVLTVEAAACVVACILSCKLEVPPE